MASPLAGPVAAAAVVLQLLVLVFLYVPAGLVVPAPAWLVLNAIGLGLLVLCVRLARQRRLAAILLPVASGLFWFAYLYVGGRLYDWTA